ncbi:methyl-accepting chemotaxis protein [Synechococcus sp. PCC 7502]|uniref:methyl-accepting chemotaxis protein n=1 Tax=Synechococcus sp. PCC 7502 TaxID=1173263 RepID=UPI00029FF176|nr:methyl-accepting chemotaxis protein [Synechococcus sp. PCC 7502]AFY75271.1 methyl-accepting chemotaxis protein [Synechococcus sp. PCC 7502]
MSDASSHPPESNPFHEDQADVEYLALVDDFDNTDDQYSDNLQEPQNKQNPVSALHISPIKPVLPFKLMIWAIACATAPACIVAGFAYQINLKSSEHALTQTQEIRAIALADSLNVFVLRQYEDTKKLSQSLAITSGLQANKKISDRQKLLITNRLNTYKNTSKAVNNIAIYNLKGNLLLKSASNQAITNLDRNNLQKLLKFNSPILISPANSSLPIQFLVPISEPKTQKIQAVLQAELPISVIRTSFTSGKYSITSTDSNQTLFASFSDRPTNLVTVPTPALSGLPDLKWNVAVGSDFEPDYGYGVILGGLTLIIVLTIAIVSYLAARRLSDRLIQATDAVNAIAQRKTEKYLNSQGNDEITDLSKQINLVTEQFQNLLNHQTHTIDQLQRLIAKGVNALQKVIQTNGEDTTSGDIEAIAAHLQASLVKKQTEINLLHRNQERLQQQISHKEVEVKELQAQTQQLYKQIEQIDQQSNHAKAELQSSSEQYKLILEEIVAQSEQREEELAQKNLEIQNLQTHLDQIKSQIKAQIKAISNTKPEDYPTPNLELMIKQIMQLREAIAVSSKKAKRLSESSQKISKVVDQIHEIAIEANFLAVNAGIKANREHSRDFSIFSEQVGKLVNMSVATMKEMEELAQNIQTETRAVMGNLETGTTQISEATKLITAIKADLHHAETVISRKLTTASDLLASLDLP